MGPAETAEATRGLLGWMKGQPFNNVMVAVLIGVIGWLGYYTLTFVIPEERKAIFENVKSIEANHTENVKTMSATYERMLDRVTENNQEQKKTNAATAAK